MNIEYSRGSSSPSSRMMDLFPQQPDFSTLTDHQTILRTGTNKSAGLETQRAQITMIYAGQVFVFNEISPEKAEEIIFLAKQEGDGQIYSRNKQQITPPTNCVTRTQNGSRHLVTSQRKSIPSFLNSLSHDVAASMTETPYGPPIARRNSLHRFLEKRQDRWESRGPYQTTGGSVAALRPAESTSWLRLAPQPP